MTRNEMLDFCVDLFSFRKSGLAFGASHVDAWARRTAKLPRGKAADIVTVFTYARSHARELTRSIDDDARGGRRTSGGC